MIRKHSVPAHMPSESRASSRRACNRLKRSSFVVLTSDSEARSSLMNRNFLPRRVEGCARRAAVLHQACWPSGPDRKEARHIPGDPSHRSSGQIGTRIPGVRSEETGEGAASTAHREPRCFAVPSRRGAGCRGLCALASEQARPDRHATPRLRLAGGKEAREGAAARGVVEGGRDVSH